MFSSKPHWSDEQVLNALREHWNVTRVTELKALPGERDQNVRVTRGEGEERLVFKVSHEEERLEAVEAQTRMLKALSGTRVAPRVVEPSVVRVGGNWVRVLTYVEGQPLACVQGGSVGERELRGLGEMAARVDEALASLSGVAPPPEDFQWDLSIYDRVVSRWIDSTPQPLRGVVERVYEKAHAMVALRASQFPRQVIHNDLNTWNVLMTPEGHLAAIDFGDAMHTWRVAELAIAAAYAMLLDGMPCTPLAICQHIAQGYESRVSLNDAERACLFPLAALRLCTSAVVSAAQMAANPENEHVAVYYEQVKRVLPKVLEVLQATPIVSFRSGTLADEPFWLASVREVLELEGTITWSDEESARQSALWRRYCADDTCTVALDAAAHIAGLVTWEFGSRTPYAPPCAANDVTPYVWIAVSYTAHAHRRQGVAKALYAEVERVARKRFAGVNHTELDIYEANVQSIHFHERIGFKNYATVFRRAVGTDINSSLASFSLRDNCVFNPSGEQVGSFSYNVTDDHPFGVSYGLYAYRFVFIREMQGRDADVLDWIVRQLDEIARANQCEWILCGVRLDNPLVAQLQSRGFSSYVRVFTSA